ncbi:MAG: 50S ribosomal protein L10 [Planctomycetia bacterium]|nr:50S ribosomal protein L10 [Planctomycetia bacterium]
MSKKVKQMELDALKDTFGEVRNFVVLTSAGVGSQADNVLRLQLRKKNIRLQMVKNSLCRKVFEGMGIKLANAWGGSTIMAWGADSVAELSKTLEAALKKLPKITVKTAVAEGQEVPFKTALTMPTRQEAIGQVVAMICGPAAQIAGCIAGPAGQIAGQIQTLAEKKPEEAAAAAPPPA